MEGLRGFFLLFFFNQCLGSLLNSQVSGPLPTEKAGPIPDSYSPWLYPATLSKWDGCGLLCGTAKCLCVLYHLRPLEGRVCADSTDVLGGFKEVFWMAS